MSSVVYFKFKANVKTDSIPFDGSSISVKDLKTAIRAKCCLYSSDFDLKLEDSNGKAYVKDEELIPKYTSIVVRRVPKLNSESQKKRTPTVEDLPWRDGQKNVNSADARLQKHVNLADSDLPEEEKIKIMMERSSEVYSEKNFAVKAKPYGIPPASYICHKCGLPGHWIHNCPGVRDTTGKMIDVKTVKRPTGIPQDFLLEVEAGTPGAYLGKSGKYMVPIKDAEAYAQGKKDKRPFSLEENPPYVPSERTPPKQFICPLCNEMFRDAVLVSCCGTTYCNECIMGHVFDSQVLGSHKCPNCGAVLSDHESSVFENALVRSMIRDWLANETGLPGPDSNNAQQDIFGVDDSQKVFVNNRRVLKPKQAFVTPSSPQIKSAEQEPEPQPKVESAPAIVQESARDTKVSSQIPTSADSVPLSSCGSLDSKDVVDVNVKHTPIVTCNTSTAVAASAPCTTLVGSGRQPLLASASCLPSSQFPCLSYSGPNPVIPTILPNINGGSNSLLNALYNMRVENLQASVAAPQVVLPVPFQGHLVGGPEWSAGTALAVSLPQATGLVDPLFQLNSDQGTYGLVPEQALPSTLPSALSASIPNVAGHKVLSKEEFYRLKMEMLHSAHRRHRHRSRSRSPLRSHRRSLRIEQEPHFRRHEESSWRHRYHRRSPDDYEPGYPQRRRYEPDDHYDARHNRSRALHYRYRSDEHDSVDIDFERQSAQERRYVRDRNIKPTEDLRTVKLKDRSLQRGSRSASVSPDRRRSREHINCYREPHAERFPQVEHERTSVSPLVSVVPQYDISEPESIESKDELKQRAASTEPQEHHLFRNRDSPHSVNKVSPEAASSGWTKADSKDLDSYINESPPEVNDVVTTGKKEKKHKKHKHRHSEKRKAKKIRRILSNLDENSHEWIANQIRSGLDYEEAVSKLVSILRKKDKKRKKHKKEAREAKKRKREQAATLIPNSPLRL
ncbi:unnamed protein product [Dicrocoelium dendriticum]|nr:unnamed protein product [Dicrocoelium dendriticum]